jgi:hypothetical protein
MRLRDGSLCLVYRLSENQEMADHPPLIGWAERRRLDK